MLERVRQHVQDNPVRSILIALAVPLITFLASWIWDTHTITVQQTAAIQELTNTTRAQWNLIKNLSDKMDAMKVSVEVMQTIQQDVILPRMVIGGEIGTINVKDLETLVGAKKVESLGSFVREKEVNARMEQKK